jgi:PIN domain nuclease of toxin-antitoxin system
LPISVEHAQRAGWLPGTHKDPGTDKDPFYRMLIAQAQAGNMPHRQQRFCL